MPPLPRTCMSTASESRHEIPGRRELPPETWGRGQNHATSERGGVGLGQAFHDARTVPFRRRFAEMDGPQLGHELRPQLRTAVGQQFGSHP